MPPWFTFWTHVADIAFGTPEVMHRRLSMMGQPGLWPLATVLESQRMVWEKALAAWQTGVGLCTAAWPALWLGAARPQATLEAVRLANRAMLPYSRAVNANVRRLRKARRR